MLAIHLNPLSTSATHSSTSSFQSCFDGAPVFDSPVDSPFEVASPAQGTSSTSLSSLHRQTFRKSSDVKIILREKLQGRRGRGRFHSDPTQSCAPPLSPFQNIYLSSGSRIDSRPPSVDVIREERNLEEVSDVMISLLSKIKLKTKPYDVANHEYFGWSFDGRCLNSI